MARNFNISALRDSFFSNIYGRRPLHQHRRHRLRCHDARPSQSINTSARKLNSVTFLPGESFFFLFLLLLFISYFFFSFSLFRGTYKTRAIRLVPAT